MPILSFLATFTVLRKTKAFNFPPYDFVPLHKLVGIEEVHVAEISLDFICKGGKVLEKPRSLAREAKLKIL